jgi:5-methylcytosine-specific restriction protein A
MRIAWTPIEVVVPYRVLSFDPADVRAEVASVACSGVPELFRVPAQEHLSDVANDSTGLVGDVELGLTGWHERSSRLMRPAPQVSNIYSNDPIRQTLIPVASLCVMATHWTRPELVVMVEALHKNSWSWIRATTPEAAELSALLRNTVVYPDGPSDPQFRSVNAIQMKGENLRTNKSGYQGKKTNGSGLDLVILADYDANPNDVLSEAAAARALFEGSSTYALLATEDDEESVNEGKQVMRQHFARERSRGIRAKKLAAVTKAGLPIACEVCGFDYGEVYGARGVGYIEVHHILPLHDSGPTETSIEDLALLCANCHR